MATLIVGGVVLLAVAAAVWKMVRDRRKGGCSCGGDCSRCSGCGHADDLEEAFALLFAPQNWVLPRLFITLRDRCNPEGSVFLNAI